MSSWLEQRTVPAVAVASPVAAVASGIDASDTSSRAVVAAGSAGASRLRVRCQRQLLRACRWATGLWAVLCWRFECRAGGLAGVASGSWRGTKTAAAVETGGWLWARSAGCCQACGGMFAACWAGQASRRPAGRTGPRRCTRESTGSGSTAAEECLSAKC